MRAAACLSALAVLLSAGPPARAADPAAPKPDAAAVAQAKTHFTAGLKLYKEGSVREALAEFLIANRIVPRASVLRNIAQCYRDLRDFATARAKYSELLATYGATLKKGEVADVNRAIAELGTLTGTIAVKASEPGASVVLDDKDLGTTPLPGPVRVNLGPHRVVVQKPGFDTVTRNLEISGGDAVVVEAPLAKEILTGHVVVTVTAAEPDPTVRLRIDGRDVGPPPFEGDLPPGPHEIVAEGTATRAAPQRIELARAARVEVPLAMKRRAGHVTIDPHQADARIRVDGVEVGTGIWEGELEIGRHDVAIDAPGFVRYERALLVHDDEKLVESAALRPVPHVEHVDDTGLYGNFTLGFAGSPAATDVYSELCRSDPSRCVQSGPPLGGALAVALGYDFGWVGLEAVGMFRGDRTDAKFAIPADAGDGWSGPGRVEHLGMTRLLGVGGLGARFFTRGSMARFTFGSALLVGRDTVVGNVAIDSTSVPLACPAGQTCDTSANLTAVKTVPVLCFDAALLLGSTPGVKFKLGAMMMLEVAGDMVADSGASFPRQLDAKTQTALVVPNVRFSQGTQLFVGPVLGMQFGH
jgi:hypothetical protein